MPTDPASLEDAYDSVVDALNYQVGATHEPRIDTAGSDETIQLQKACRLLTACNHLQKHACYGSVVELSFGAMERTMEAYLIAVTGSDLSDFQDHTTVYERAKTHGPISREFARNLKALYANNRTDYYYDNAVSTEEIAAAMMTLAVELHRFVVNHGSTDRFEQSCVCTTHQ